MVKLNRKGYMLVEIIIAAVLAVSIAYYLLNLTYKFKNTNTDVQESYYYVKDKILVTENIMNDLGRGIVSSVSKKSDIDNFSYEVNFKILIKNVSEKRKLKISKTSLGATLIEYGKVNDEGVFVVDDISYYEKEFEKSLIVEEPEIGVNGDTLMVKIPLSSLYTDNVYDIVIFSPFYRLLSEVEPGSYVKYVGNNGCEGKKCEGQNANYVSDSARGYCPGYENNEEKEEEYKKYQFNSDGWRVAYVANESAYLTTAGAPECLSTNETGDYTNDYIHIANMDVIAEKYCNKDYVYEGTCDSNSVWAMDDADFQNIVGVTLLQALTYNNYTKNNDLINNGGLYWFATIDEIHVFYFQLPTAAVQHYGANLILGVRPVIRMAPRVLVVGGTGTYDDPYLIDNAM